MRSGSSYAENVWSIPRQHRSALLALVALAAFLRFFRIGHQSFWADEARTIWALTGLEQGLQHFFHGPLHTVLLYFWSIWGGYGDAWTRSLSAIVGLLTLPVFYLLARRLGGARVALMATFLLAISPFHVWYSQEVRNYSLLIGVATLSQILFIRILDGGGRRAWIGYGLTTIAIMLCNFAGIFLILAQGGYLFLCRRHLLLRFIMLQALVFLILLPWLSNYRSGWEPGMVGQSPHRKVNFHPMGLPFTFSVFSVGFTVGPSLNEMNRALSLRLFLPHLWYFALVAALYGFLSIRGFVSRWRKEHGVIFYALWLGVPPLLVAVLAFLNVKVFNPRYAAVAFPGFLILVAAGLDLYRKRWRLALAILVAAVCAYSLWNHYYSPRYWKPDARSAAGYVEAAVEPGDAILVYAAWEPFFYYYHGDVPAQRLRWGTLQREDRLREFLDRLLSDYARVWLVDYRSWYVDPKGTVPQALEREWNVVEKREFVGMSVSLFESRRADAASP